MCRELIICLILSISAEYGVPGYFVKSIAIEESNLNPNAVSPANSNGTRDFGIMQLNNNYFSHVDWRCVESNIRAGVAHIRWLMTVPGVNTFWAVAAAYNCGHARLLRHGPPQTTIDYANRVIARWRTFECNPPIVVWCNPDIVQASSRSF